MKKLLVWLVLGAFLFGIVGEVVAQTSPEKIKAYIKTLEAKLKKAKTKAARAKLQKEIAAQKARLKKLEAEMAAPPPPPPAPVAPVPPPSPAPAAVKPAAPAGLFGMGLNTNLSGLYINTGKGTVSGAVGLRGDVVLDDFIGLGPMVGLSANAVKYTLGVGAIYGGGGYKAIPVYAGGIINLPADMMGGLETYLAGALNYVVYGNGQTSGSLAGDIYAGFLVDLGLGLGKTGIQLGWAAVKPADAGAITGVGAAKGFSLSVCQPIVL